MNFALSMTKWYTSYERLESLLYHGGKKYVNIMFHLQIFEYSFLHHQDASFQGSMLYVDGSNSIKQHDKLFFFG